MERKLIVIIALLIALSFLVGFFVNKISFTGRVIQEQQLAPEQYYWTKAICNPNNECIDVKVVCENGIAKSVEPVSQIIQHNADWQDPRGNLSEELC